VAQFFRAWPQVAESWGFGRLTTGEGGIKTFFTGDSGTGKTLAAEVIAGLLNMPLLKVDLARVVSKWVGETEKHLEAAFRAAEESHAVLFFDEADALFGKRGEVQHGTDRYANLEVSYLLQRLEDHYGLVILASNLNDNIDAAFMRRFQIVIHFPRPEPDERRRIWEIAFPKTAPVEAGIDFSALARLDLTGAGTVGAARTAALLAADEASETITIAHIVRAIARQYYREARILTASELGHYAAFLSEVR
jgi:SpoVK/Ycf46/Vps4 family AAA+-type ATPase